MDKITERRDLIKRLLSRHVALVNRHHHSDVESVLVADEERDHYLWLKVGWSHGQRIKAITVYVRLRKGQFWVEEDWTEDGIATELMEAGVPAEDIVLAFHSPETRPSTDLAAV